MLLSNTDRYTVEFVNNNMYTVADTGGIAMVSAETDAMRAPNLFTISVGDKTTRSYT